MKKLKKDNVVNFPSSLSEGEKEVEAILFAAAEPLDIDTIESKLPKKVRNKMGFHKSGGRVGMGKALRGGGRVR